MGNIEKLKNFFREKGVYFSPVISKSYRWLTWYTRIKVGTCNSCIELCNKILDFTEEGFREPPLHPYCDCYTVILNAIQAGTATIKGMFGADVWMKNYRELPANYINKKMAEKLGWKKEFGNLHFVAPGAIMGGDVYCNDEDILPAASGRVWREADINYTGGYRNGHRLLYSNDGLLFVTYDHYNTFYEIR